MNQGEITHITGDINFAAIPIRSSSLVLTVLDCSDLLERRDLTGVLLRKLWFQFPVRRARVVTTISHASRDELVQMTGISESRISVIPVAISRSFRKKAKDFNKGHPRVLHVGTAQNKNLERTAAALAGIPCTLVIVGQLSDSQKRALEENKISIENYCKISNDEIIRHYEMADIVSFVSTREGFGMPIVEGNSIGRPVITSKRSSMPEVAGDAAHLVDPFDVQDIRNGFLRVMNDEAYRHELVRKGFQNAKRFDGDQIARQYLEIYRSMGQKRGTN
ncbi:MAG: glycosyltransferase family 1 protein [Pirellula sp.]